MEIILEHIDNINTSIIRKTGGKISFNRADQLAIRQATQKLTAMLTRLVFEKKKTTETQETRNSDTGTPQAEGQIAGKQQNLAS
ncbi:hypothetical protein JTB14_000715 [Gonioctena quinquepunctata]|nr:hypothetical protein JTB14_000715 [Gonioctena quinquepunctata]